MKMYTFTWNWGFFENWLIDATSLLVSYVGDIDVVKHSFKHKDTTWIRQ